ncbi:MAG: AAA family ATPase [Clostridia bacterium]|nr:AAA family ATPase [Clostridia bacterium]
MTDNELFEDLKGLSLEELNKQEPILYGAETSTRTCAFDRIPKRPPRFLWYPYLRAANLNLLSGDGGSGKTTLALMIAAALADGDQPGGMPGLLQLRDPRGENTLILSFEDEPEELRYRLEGCGCKHPEHIFTMKPNESAPPMTEEQTLTSLVEECGAKLLIIDPVQAFLQSGADANSMSDVRKALESLRRVCKKTGCAALLIAHLNKGVGRSAMQRTSGSMDFVNAVRSAMMVVRHPRTADMRCAMHFKSNGAALGESLCFTLGENAGAIFSGLCDVSREELETADNPPDETETSPKKVQRFLERLGRSLPEWSMTAAELSMRPENTEGLSPRTIAFCIGKATAAMGLSLQQEMKRNILRYTVSWKQTQIS